MASHINPTQMALTNANNEEGSHSCSHSCDSDSTDSLPSLESIDSQNSNESDVEVMSVRVRESKTQNVMIEELQEIHCKTHSKRQNSNQRNGRKDGDREVLIIDTIVYKVL